MKRLLCVWLPNWPIQRIRVEKQNPVDAALEDRHAAAAGSPIVLWREDPRRGRLVVACCQRARALGVAVSMPIAQASEMLQGGKPSGQPASQPWVLPQDLSADDRSLRKVALELQKQITPLVAIESIGEKPWAGYPRHQSEALLGDITGVAHLFGGEIGLLQATARLLKKIGFEARMAIADSVGAAWALSHFSPHLTRESPFLVAPLGTLRGPIEPLPVESLRLDSETVATLSRLGISRVDQLLQLPRSGLAARLGVALVRRIEQALGEVQEPIDVHHAPAEHWATLTLEYPTSDQEILADRIDRLTQKVRAGLAVCQRGALRMACRLDLSDHPPLTLEIGLFAPTMDADHLSGLLLHQLEAKKLPSSVEQLTVSVTLSGPLRSAQGSLFEHSDASTDSMSGSAISRLVDSLSGRLGRDAVVRVELQDDPLPENAFRTIPLAGNRVLSRKRKSSRGSKRSKVSKNSTVGSPGSRQSSVHSTSFESVSAYQRRRRFEPSPDDAMRRPLSLFAEPIPLAIAWEGGAFYRSVSSPQLPRRIRLGGRIHQVVRHWGPERIETGWWKGPSVGRDYYRIETDRGRWWWIYRNLVSKAQVSAEKCPYRWMLHGQFD